MESERCTSSMKTFQGKLTTLRYTMSTSTVVHQFTIIKCLHHIRTRLCSLSLKMLHDLYESTLTLHWCNLNKASNMDLYRLQFLQNRIEINIYEYKSPPSRFIDFLFILHGLDKCHRRKPTLYCTTLRYVYIPWATTRDFSLNSLNMRELW